MNKKTFNNIIIILIIFFGFQTKPLKAEDGFGFIASAVAVGGATYLGYKAWNFYKAYTQERTFEKAKELLKETSFWGGSEPTYILNGQEIINSINQLAAQGYKPALYFQAEHPWLFVDGIISEFAPQIHQPLFYERYAPYSIKKYQKLGILGDAQGYFNAGNLGLAWLYIKYANGIVYAQISHEIKEYLGYLDAAACLGHQGAVNEIVRVYQEGLLVKYNQRLITEIPAYYDAIQKMNNYIYPISSFRIWIFKNYYNLLNLAPTSRA